MVDRKKITRAEAEKQRLLDALRELKKDGVMLIDDRVGRPVVISARSRTEVVESRKNEKSTELLLLENLDQMFIEESTADNDPYNRRFK